MDLWYPVDMELFELFWLLMAIAVLVQLWQWLRRIFVRRRINELQGGVTDAELQAFMSEFSSGFPNYPEIWQALRAKDALVRSSSTVSREMKAEFHTFLLGHGVNVR